MRLSSMIRSLLLCCVCCKVSAASVEYRSVVENGEISFTCDSPVSSSIWSRNGTSISLGADNRLSTDGVLLRINPVRRTDTGRYTCTFGITTHSLFVIVPPVVSLPQQVRASFSAPLLLSYTLLEGSNITGALWSRSGQDLQTSATVSISGSMLRVSQLSSADAGVYSVTVANQAGSHQATTAVIVTFPPEVAPVEARPEALVTPTQPVTLTCRVRSNPPITALAWTRREGPSGNAESLTSFTRNDSALSFDQTLTTSTYVVTSFGGDHQFTYSCMAVNSLGSGSGQITIQEGDLPPPPSNVAVSDITSTSATVRWDSLDTALVNRVWLAWTMAGIPAATSVVSVGNDQNSYTLTTLQPGSSYVVTVTSNNSVGDSVSDEVPFVTLLTVPTLPVINLKLEWILSEEAVGLSWQSAPEEPTRSAVEGYEVSVGGRPSLRVVGTTANVTGLTRGAELGFGVAPYNNGGNGPVVQLPYTIPGVGRSPPQGTSVGRITSSSFGILWSRPSDHQHLQEYNVTVMLGSVGVVRTVDRDKTMVCYSHNSPLSDNYRVVLTSVYTDGSSASSGNFPLANSFPSSGGDDCSSLFNNGTRVEASPDPSLDSTAIAAIAVVAVVAILGGVVCAIVVAVFMVRRRSRSLELDTTASTGHMVPPGRSLSPPLDSPLSKGSFVYNKTLDSAKLQYYDISNLYKHPNPDHSAAQRGISNLLAEKMDDIDVQIVGVEV